MRELRALGREVAMQLRLVLRTPSGILFTVALPLLMIPLLHSLNRGVVVFLRGGTAPLTRDQYYVPAVAAFSVASCCFGQLAVRTTIAREQGILKRLRGSPVTPATHLAARILSVMTLGLAVVAVSIALGVGAYDVELGDGWLGPTLVVTLLGAATCSALGLAASRLATTTDAAPAVTSAILIPVAFVSSTFYPAHLTPRWMADIGAWLPLQPFTVALTHALDPASGAIPRWDLGRLVAWLVGGAVLATVTFTWVPAAERRGGRRTVVIALGAVVVVGIAAIALHADEDSGGIRGFTSSGTISDDPVPLDVTRADVEEAGVLATDATVGQESGSYALPIVLVDDDGDIRGFYFDRLCQPVLTDVVDPAWLGSITTESADALFVGLCMGAAFDGGGRCLDPCTADLTPVDVIEGAAGALEVRPANDISYAGWQAPTAVVSYLDAAGRPASLVTDGTGLLLSAAGVTVQLEAPGRGGLLTSIQIGEHTVQAEDVIGTPWLSLPLGESGVDADIRTEHLADGTWVAESGDLRVELRGSGPVLAWDQLSVVIVDGGQRTAIELRRP